MPNLNKVFKKKENLDKNSTEDSLKHIQTFYKKILQDISQIPNFVKKIQYSKSNSVIDSCLR